MAGNFLAIFGPGPNCRYLVSYWLISFLGEHYFELFLSGEYLCELQQNLQCGMKPDGTCHAFNGEGRCTKELIIGQKPFIDWYDRANPEMNNYNWEMFITEDGYEGRAPKRPVLISVQLPVQLSVSLLAPLSVLLPVLLSVLLPVSLLAPLSVLLPILLPVSLPVQLPVLLPFSLLAPLSVLISVQLPVQLLAPLLAPLLATFPVLFPVHPYIFSRS